jgi:aminopeptidase
MDRRVEYLAKILVHYSLEVKPDQLFKIRAEPSAEPLVKAVYEEAVRTGAHVYTQITLINLTESFFKLGNDEQLSYVSPIMKLEYEKMDAFLHIWGTTNTKFLSGVNPKRIQLNSKAMEPLRNQFFRRAAEGTLRWTGTQFPTEAHAQDAEMSLADYEDFVYRAGHVFEDDPVAYWQGVEKEQQRLVDILNQTDKINLRAEDTDLTVRVKDRKWINCCGKENFPDGEIFTSPLDDSASGTVKFTFPAFYQGREADGVRLTFKGGKVVKATAGKNEDFLLAMLDTDDGARRLGEFAIGTNYEIARFTRNTLFDEKIGGTCHLAVGTAFLETGGSNRSGIHWDMVLDMKKGGEIEADGKLIYKDGKFLI